MVNISMNLGRNIQVLKLNINKISEYIILMNPTSFE